MSRLMESWGRRPRTSHEAEVIALASRSEPLPTTQGSLLARGLGRSYGDSCLNDSGTLLDARGIDRFIAFDQDRGLLTCEAGASLADILALILPAGYFLPVSPGTKHVTVGGAIANDVHGKNHHRVGSFGHHVLRFELLRSDGSRLECSREQNADYFRATIGGLGLTGLVTWAQIQLLAVSGPWIEQVLTPFRGLDELLELGSAHEARHAYSVGWIDCAARGRHAGRGILISGDHSTRPGLHASDLEARAARWCIPTDLPFSPLNRWTVGAFNGLYHAVKSRSAGRSVVHHDGFFYPLDGVRHWNRLYGPAGLLQHQCVVPDSSAGRGVIGRILSRTAESGKASPLVVIKRFGSMPSEGLLSFARPGITLALDFPAGDGEHYAMLDDFDRWIVETGGALYPAKDSRMTPSTFRASFPALERFERFVDPRFSSSFWRRVRG